MPRNQTRAGGTSTTTTTQSEQRDERKHGLTFIYDEEIGAPPGVPTSIVVAKELCIDADGNIPATDQTFDVYTAETAETLGPSGYVAPIGVLTRAFISIVNQFNGGDVTIRLSALRAAKGAWVIRDNIAVARLKGLAARVTTSVPPKRGARVHDTVDAGASDMRAIMVDTNLYVVGGPTGSSHIDALIVPVAEDVPEGRSFNDGISVPTSFVLSVLPDKSDHYLRMLARRNIAPPPFMVERAEYTFTAGVERGTYMMSILVNGALQTYKMTITPGVWRTVKGDTTGHCRFVVEWPVPGSQGDAVCRIVFAGVVDRVDGDVGYIGEGSGAVTVYGMEDIVVTRTNSKNAVTMRIAGRAHSTNIAETLQVGDWFREFGNEAGSSWGFIGGAVTAQDPADGTLMTVVSEKTESFATLMGIDDMRFEDITGYVGARLGATNNISRAITITKSVVGDQVYHELCLPVDAAVEDKARRDGDIFVLMYNTAPILNPDGTRATPILVEVGRGTIGSALILGDERVVNQQNLPGPEIRLEILTIKLNPVQRDLGHFDGSEYGNIRGGAEVRRLLYPTSTKSENERVTDGSYCIATEYNASSTCGIEVEDIVANPNARKVAETILAKVMGQGFKLSSSRWWIQQMALSAAADRRQTTGANGKLRRVNELDFLRAILATVAADSSVRDAPTLVPGSTLSVTGAREGSDGVIHEVSAHDLKILTGKFPVSTAVTRAGGVTEKDELQSASKLMLSMFANTPYTPFGPLTAPVDFLTQHQLKRHSKGHIAELNGKGTFVYLDKPISIFQDKCMTAVGAKLNTPRFFRMFTGETVVFYYSTGNRRNQLKNKPISEALAMEGILVCARQRKTAASLNTAFGGRS